MGGQEEVEAIWDSMSQDARVELMNKTGTMDFYVTEEQKSNKFSELPLGLKVRVELILGDFE